MWAMATMVHPSREMQRQTDVATPCAVSPADAPADPAQTYLRLFMLVCLYAIPLFATLQLDADYDSWWHLRAGQWIVEHRTVTTTDPFSTYGHDKTWVAYSWLFEVAIYGLYQAFGLCGFIVYRAMLALAVTAALHRFVAKREPRFLHTVGLTGFAVLGVAMLFKERPWLFTILFTTFTLDAILDLREGRRGPLVWLLPLVFVLWANIHIQFVYGLILLVLACAVPLLDRFRRCEPEQGGAGRFGSGDWRFLLGLTAACFLATLATPYHVQLYRVIFEYATQPGPYRFINELKALEFREIPDWVMLAFAGLATYTLGRWPRQGCFDLLLLVLSAFLAFRMRRDMWIVILTALYLLSTPSRSAVPLAQRFGWTGWRAGMVSGGVALLVLLTITVRHISNANMEREAAKLFPVEAAKFVAEKDYPGPLYNDFNWGGYLIWTLPQYPVSVDGRTNLHGDERILRFGRIWAGSPSWRDDPDLGAAGLVIAGAEMPLCGLLALDERFELVYQDDVARVFVRKSPRVE
jgi:hypothetical protein